MSEQSHDVAIIGGGHNGLVCAAYLARAGKRVVVLERNAKVGGAAITEEFHPGFRNSVASYTVSLLNPKIIADLALAVHGLRIVERPVANFWPVDAGRYLLLPYGFTNRQAAIRAFSARDAERLAEYDTDLERAAAILRDLVLRTPPNAGDGISGMLRHTGLARELYGLSLEDQRLLVDLFTKSAAEFLERYFESDVVKAAFAFDGIVGAYASPTTPGTAYVLLHHCFGEVNGNPGVWGHALGGMGAISDAIAASARASGAVIRTETPVAQVLAHKSRARGEEIQAHVVAANVGAKLLFRDLIPDGSVEPELSRRFRDIRTGSGTFRMNVALSELPSFTCRPSTAMQDHHGSGIIIGASLRYLERAYLDARLHGWSRQPVVEMLIPSTLDPSLAPEGRHVASLFVQHVAPRLPEGRNWADETEKQRFADLVVETVNAHAPNFKASVLGRQVLSPL